MDLRFNVPSLLSQFNQFLGYNGMQPEVRLRSPQSDLVIIESPGLVYLNELVLESFKKSPGGEILGAYVLLHEWYHYINQNITSFSEAIQTIELFGERPRYEFDIEVDVVVYSFLKNALGFDFYDYLTRVYHPLFGFFPVDSLRPIKVERHFGSLWSIMNSYSQVQNLMIPSLEEYFEESDVLVHVPVRQYSPIRKIHRLGLLRKDIDNWVAALLSPSDDPEEFALVMTDLASAFSKGSEIEATKVSPGG